MKERLDILLVKKGLCPSREKAKASIMAGIVYVDGQKSDKAGNMVDENADMIVLNSTRIPDTTFRSDDNQVTIISKHHQKAFTKKPKAEVAKDIIDELEKLL